MTSGTHTKKDIWIAASLIVLLGIASDALLVVPLKYCAPRRRSMRTLERSAWLVTLVEFLSALSSRC